MRVQLALRPRGRELATLVVGLALALLGPGTARADDVEIEGDVEARESVYVDDDATTVSTTSADTTVKFAGPGLAFRGGYVLDAVTTASVDVRTVADVGPVVDAMTAATSHWTENRHQGSAGVTFERDLWVADAGYTFSDENDWTSHTGTVSLGRDFFQRNTNVTAGYVFVDNQVFRANDDSFRDKMRTHAASVAITQVLGVRTNSRITGFFSDNRGFQSSPYRWAPFAGAGGLGCAHATNGYCWAREAHPELRLRGSVSGTVIQGVGKGKPASLLGSYRYYGDSWEVGSHTLELAYRQELSRHFLLRLRSRTYYQDAAYFFEDGYSTRRRYMTIDRELSPFFHQLTGAKLTMRTGLRSKITDLRFDLKADFFYFKFFDFHRLPSRIGGIFEAGLRLVY